MPYALSSEQCRAIIQTSQLDRELNFRDLPFPSDGYTEARPGTEGKIAVFAERAERGEQIFHPGDLTVEQCKILESLSSGKAKHARNGRSSRHPDRNLTILCKAKF